MFKWQGDREEKLCTDGHGIVESPLIQLMKKTDEHSMKSKMLRNSNNAHPTNQISIGKLCFMLQIYEKDRHQTGNLSKQMEDQKQP